MPASGEFEVSEGGAVAASGRIRAADDKVVVKQLKGTPDEITDYELKKEEIYKICSILGLRVQRRLPEYPEGRHAETLRKTDVEGQLGDLQLSICLAARKDAFRLPARVQKCHIDPRLHPQAVEDDKSGVVHAVYDSCLDICCAGGVTIQALKSTVATSQSSRDSPCFEKYQFVPYIDDQGESEEPESDLQEYVSACSAAVKRIVKAGGAEASTVSGLKLYSCEASEEKLDRYLKETVKNKGLLRALTTIESKLKGGCLSLAAAVKCILTTKKNDLDEDILNKALLEEIYLRPLLDIIVENTNVKKIHVLELACGESSLLLTLYVSELLPLSNVVLKADYTLAHQSPDKLTVEQLSEHVTRYLWNLCSDAINSLPEAHLMIAYINISASNELETLGLQLSTLCKERAFVLLCLRTALTSAEAFLSAAGDASARVYIFKRYSGVYILETCGLTLVGLRANRWSALLLLRKRAAIGNIMEQEVVRVKNMAFDWIDTLKAKIVECESKHKGQNLWLVSEDKGMSGLIGLMNCLLQESGTSCGMCVFDASIKLSGSETHFTLSDQTFRELLERYLVMNVYRDGRWGSFRHLTILSDGAQKRATEYAFLNVHTRGDLSSLKWYDSALRCCSSPSESGDTLLCSVYYTALNFRDVMIATVKLSADALPGGVATSECLLGLEFSGRDPQGHRVMGLVPSKGMWSAVLADTDLLWKVPDSWSLEEASTIPVAYCTAYYALLMRGNLQSRESLLIHSGSGGVGQAAIFIALSMGCAVFTTVGLIMKVPCGHVLAQIPLQGQKQGTIAESAWYMNRVYSRNAS